MDLDPTLVRDVDLLCLDAGNTVVFLDHERLARACVREGFTTTPDALLIAEGDMKRVLEHGAGIDAVGSQSHGVSARSWGVVVGTILSVAGLEGGRIGPVLDALWA